MVGQAHPNVCALAMKFLKIEISKRTLKHPIKAVKGPANF